ncbi:antA/AntB antirepressor family protein [Nitrosomonas sp. Is79A3]|uniref:antA/AntB antirepressor family protein n=1 Tax=Nitrosomonas sp. (strain Is79A3) TaxID=261292 RepID=UPI0018DC2E96
MGAERLADSLDRPNNQTSTAHPNSNNVLTFQLVRDYSFPVTAKSVAGFDSPEKAANSRNVSSNAVFLRLVSPFMGGLDGEPQGSPVRFPGLSTRLVPPTCLTAGVRLNQLNESEHIMTNIIPVVSRIFQGKPTPAVDAENLYSFLSITTRFDTWFNRRVSEYGFVEGESYCSNLSDRSDGKAGKPRNKYYVTLDMAKELAMVERTEKGREARRYFIECEKQLKEKQQAKALPNLEKKRYHYPRHLLEQEYFTSPTRSAKLSISMLGNEKEFSSTLLNLLLELKMDGHNVHAPYDEYMAMREAIIKANRAMDEILHIVLKATAQPASTAGN